MLTDLHVRDFAIVDEVELEFGPGLTVLTGETGAGKSILVDALGLALGNRADASAVRHGKSRAEIVATFRSDRIDHLDAWLAEHDLDADGECLIRRVIGREGRSRAYVNGTVVPLQTLRELALRLADIHGQQTNHSLVRPGVQREILDDHGGLQADLDRVATVFADWRSLCDERERLRTAGSGDARHLELIGHQVQELDALALGEGELESLDAEHRRLANQGRLAETLQSALGSLADETGNGATKRLFDAARALEESATFDPALNETRELLESAHIQAGEATDNLERYASALDAEPDRLDEIEARLASIHELARKHGVRPAGLREAAERVRDELDALTNADERLRTVDARLAKSDACYRKAASKLHARRESAARALESEIGERIRQLGMPQARFEISIQENERYAVHGLDDVAFLVTTNAGQPPGPLAKVASGGELARISLALEVVAAATTDIPCMVFDEVDSGIGGGVAEIVGRRLRALSESRQVLCVTHLPQVASQAHHHIRVRKNSDGDETRTHLELLDDDETVEELARMLGGVKITGRARAHAREMRDRAGADQEAG